MIVTQLVTTGLVREGTRVQTHWNSFQVDFAVQDHGDKVTRVLLIQYYIDWDLTRCCFQEVSKNVNVCEHIHDHCNDLKKNSRSKYTFLMMA